MLGKHLPPPTRLSFIIIIHREAGQNDASFVCTWGESKRRNSVYWHWIQQWERLKWTGKGILSMSSAEVGYVVCYSLWWEEPSSNGVQRTFFALGFPFLSFINYKTGFYFGDLADLETPLPQPPSAGIKGLFSLHSYLSFLKSSSASHFWSQIWLGNSRQLTQTSVHCFSFLAGAVLSWLKLFPTTYRDFIREVVSGLPPTLCYVISLEPIHHNTFLLSLGGLKILVSMSPSLRGDHSGDKTCHSRCLNQCGKAS